MRVLLAVAGRSAVQVTQARLPTAFSNIPNAPAWRSYLIHRAAGWRNRHIEWVIQATGEVVRKQLPYRFGPAHEKEPRRKMHPRQYDACSTKVYFRPSRA